MALGCWKRGRRTGRWLGLGLGFNPNPNTNPNPNPNPNPNQAHGMSDSLYLIDFDQGAAHVDIEHKGGYTADKGGYVPVALAEAGELVYHFRSPTEAGDLWRCTASLLQGASKTRAERLTHTMPPALRAKLSAPEVRVRVRP